MLAKVKINEYKVSVCYTLWLTTVGKHTVYRILTQSMLYIYILRTVVDETEK